MVLHRVFEYETEVPEGFQVAGGAAVGFLKGKAEDAGEDEAEREEKGKVLDSPM